MNFLYGSKIINIGPCNVSQLVYEFNTNGSRKDNQNVTGVINFSNRFQNR